ncbi:MAG: signal recognition particle-docking protein FtsY [Proteobacteria bacterium]|nr:signal recognition particle-docking protein FtsY [Pseudomonadota bacterium]
MGILNSLKNKLNKTTENINSSLEKIFIHKKLDDNILQNIEDSLIQADIGVENAIKIIEDLRKDKFGKDVTVEEVKFFIAEKLSTKLENLAKPIEFDSEKPFILFMLGVNGSGKTTTIGKLSKQLKDQGKKVLLISADTFRAGAVDQLNHWAELTKTEIFKPAKENADPSATIYQGLEYSKTQDFDVVIIDTAGRLQNRQDLMVQLNKMMTTVKKHYPEAPHSCMLVIDATVGQNGLSQAKLFKEHANVTHLTITKLDGSAKAGCLIPIASEFNIPVSYVGVGESVEDLKDFSTQDFINSLLDIE